MKNDQLLIVSVFVLAVAAVAAWMYWGKSSSLQSLVEKEHEKMEAGPTCGQSGSQTRSAWVHATQGYDPNLRQLLQYFANRVTGRETCDELWKKWCEAKSFNPTRDSGILRIESALLGNEAGSEDTPSQDFCRNVMQLLDWWNKEGSVEGATRATINAQHVVGQQGFA